MSTTRCNWKTSTGKQCTNNILLDGFCSRHLKQKCSICMEDVRSTNSAHTKRLACGHSFHFNCIIKWFVTSDECPTCRTKQPNDPIIQFKDQIENELRQKYMDAIRSLETDNMRLNNMLQRNIRRHNETMRNNR